MRGRSSHKEGAGLDRGGTDPFRVDTALEGTGGNVKKGMSSAFERSLRGAAAPAGVTRGSTSEASRYSSGAGGNDAALAARRKKSVTWDDDDESNFQLVSGRVSSARERSNSASDGGVLVSSTNGSNLRSVYEQQHSNDHLRVRAARPRAADTGGRGCDNTTSSACAPTASSNRKRLGERSIPAGAVRVRTPAKPKRPRPDSLNTSTAVSAHQNDASRGSERAAPHHNYLRRGAAAVTAASVAAAKMHSLSPKASPRPRMRISAPSSSIPAGRASPSTYRMSPRTQGVATRQQPRPSTGDMARSTPTAAAPSPRKCRVSSSQQALRDFAEGVSDEGEDSVEMPGDPSPVSMLSSNLSSIGIMSAKKPPRSPRAGGGGGGSYAGGGFFGGRPSPRASGTRRSSRLSPDGEEMGSSGGVRKGIASPIEYDPFQALEEEEEDDKKEDDVEVRL